ncbi:recombinase RecT [Pectobacterium sp. A535-S3-A17]|uniref:Recombinase RecT n=1 Tax=Pectobacterium quasiaquaticum TaxID=2774015 RepID=A0A9Q2EQ87_9GAMM|nr:RecT family recombinase [Pectobacterium quasiaquaticum]MBE5213239.1 recombinase RecT [Pectobacterium quasiaquaticum]MBE5221644.1 recombinase RecT [Pectobacterium quasiaquaticum]MBE5224111.1 recombinase RecT [Pectobacterium quasiaquaticum]URG50584.1 recombinase RecT [Pectobacterium quasiaquaticum]
MQNSNVSLSDQNTVVNSNVALFDSQYLNAISTFAQIMAQGSATVPAHLQGNQADCMAVAMQAAQWQMNPFAVAQKTHLIKGVLGYEAQLVNAVISRSGVLSNRFEYKRFGPWEKILGRFEIRKNKEGQEYRVPGWSMADEEGVGIKIWATLRGEDVPRELELFLAQARVRNSTLWADDPYQQLAYLAVKRWSRLYCPDVILGVYTPDELEERSEKDVTPASTTQVSLKAIVKSSTADAPEKTVSSQESTSNIDALADDFRDQIEKADDVDKAKAIRADIETQKSALGTALFTELKNKAVKRYYLVNAKNQIEAEINSLPQPDEPDAVEKFAALEKSLAAAKRHLGDELHDQFAVTLCDMKPEYVY